MLIILVADDNRDAANTLAALLRLRGHEVRVAHDGHAALRLARELHPHAGILDVGMPKLTGHEVARRIRSEPWGRNILLVAVSGWGAPRDKERAWEAGFDHHFTKPAEFEDLISVVESRIATH